MIRALQETVPPEDLEFFSAAAPEKDAGRFWDLLRKWYQDVSDGSWYADWGGFIFPAGEADFTNATFTKAKFSRRGIFFAPPEPATFSGDADFSYSKLKDADFTGVTFPGKASFTQTLFAGNADFIGATFGGEAGFHWAVFTGHADFTGVTFAGKANFFSVRLADGAAFAHLTFLDDGVLQIAQAGTRAALFSSDTAPVGAALMRFYGTSLERVDLEKLDVREIRFREALDIDKLTFREVEWPVHGSGYRVADESDLEAAIEAVKQFNGGTIDYLASLKRLRELSWHEVERIYRSLRKNHEDHHDRVAAHKWYYAEMEIGRRYPTWQERRAEAAQQNRAQAEKSLDGNGFLSRSVRRLSELFPLRHLSRDFYKWTSNYGLSAIRAAVWLLAIGLVAFGLFMIPSPEVCPMVEARMAEVRQCASAESVAKTVMLSIFLQPPPEGLAFSGFLGQAIWLLTRLFGAAMLLSIGVAFRNQVAR